METLATFLRKLAKHEGTPAADLIAPWLPGDVASVTNAFNAAMSHTRIQFSVEGDLSVQALGNRVADAVADGLQQHLSGYELLPCSGQGYPDRRLQRKRDGRSFALELKAKTELDPTDTQRMILTSGTRKIRRSFGRGEPICHVLTTAVYSTERRGARRHILVEGLDFDFLEPWTMVQNQYEASVNQRLLAKGEHARRLLMWQPTKRSKRLTGPSAHEVRLEDHSIVIS